MEPYLQRSVFFVDRDFQIINKMLPGAQGAMPDRGLVCAPTVTPREMNSNDRRQFPRNTRGVAERFNDNRTTASETVRPN